MSKKPPHTCKKINRVETTYREKGEERTVVRWFCLCGKQVN